MKTGEAERHIKEQLKEIYQESEAINIADLALEHITGFSRSARLSKKEETLSAYHLQNVHEFIRRLQLRFHWLAEQLQSARLRVLCSRTGMW